MTVRHAVLDEDEVRSRLRVAAARRKPRQARAWEPPTLSDAATGHVLAFDQTLRHTGWVDMYVGHAEGTKDWSLVVQWAGTINLPGWPDVRGFEETYRLALEMGAAVRRIVDRHSAYNRAPLVVHEMPSVSGFRTESSLMAGLGVRQAAEHFGLPVAMVSNTHMKAVLGGPTMGRSKADVRRALEAVLGELPRPAMGGTWNEHTRDALALGLTALIDRERAS